MGAWLFPALHDCDEKEAIFPYLQCVVSKWVLCLHACTYLSAIKQCGWPEISQPLWFQSKDVRDLDVLYRYLSLITPPSLWCALIIRVERRMECVWGSPVFFSFSLPPFCMWQFARWECNVPRGGSATVSGARFYQFPVKIYSSIEWNATQTDIFKHVQG